MKKIILSFLIIAFPLALLFFFALRKNKFNHRPAVKIVKEAGQEKAFFLVEVARTRKERERGLMFRKNLAENQGMLFVFPQEKPRWFWMKNTLIPLDMIFIDRNQRIIGIVEQAIPEKEDLLGGWKSKFVLEINAGLVKKCGIKEGDKVEFINLKID